jgi:trigger factor
MKVEKKDLEKSQVELLVKLSVEEFKPYIEKGIKKISEEAKIDGFRSGKVPYEILKQKVGEMVILEEAARIAINATLEEVIKKHVEGDPVGSPKVDIAKLAPNNPMEYKLVLALLPEVKIEKYKDLKIKEKKAEIDPKELQKTLDELREMRVQEALVNEEIKDGHKAIVDMEMFLDNVPVDGGQTKDTAVIIGKDYIIPGFDKKLIGAKKGETKNFSLPYPKEHHMQNLAGKMVDFKVIIKDVYKREMPELNDKFATGLGLKTIDELRKNIEKNILEQKQKENAQMTEKEMLEKIIDNTKFGDLAEMLIEHESSTMMQELKYQVESQSAKFDEYLSSINKTQDQLTLDMLPEAIKRVKVSLIIREVAKLEKISASEEDLKKHIKGMRDYYQNPQTQGEEKDKQEILKRLDTPEYKSYVLNVLNSQKVIENLRKWNVLK